MDLEALIKKIPKPVLVIGVLIIALALFIYNEPLTDECAVQTDIFEKNTAELLYGKKINKKTQYPQIDYWKDRCRKGNSIGACEDYFEGLRVVVRELKRVNAHCHVKLVESRPKLATHISGGIQIMSLVAWGEKPPAGLADRLGWLTEADVRTFCYLKKVFPAMAGEDALTQLRNKVYAEYPDAWSEKFDVNSLTVAGDPEKTDVAKLVAENRPRAYKTPANPGGALSKEQVYERSLFSIRCDLYM